MSAAMDLADYANENPPGARVGPLAAYMREEDLVSPIDIYRKGVRDILQYGQPQVLEDVDFLGRLLVLGIVSAAEGYVRGVLSTCMELCPVSRSTAASKSINLGGLLWHGKAGFSRSVFEHASFTSKDELTKACRDYVGCNLDDATFKSLLVEYEKVCQLRHGIVHGDGFLPGRNAVQLDIPRFAKPVRITIRFAQLQEVAAVVNTLVFTLNRHLFVEMCKRWAVEWRRRNDWEPAAEAASFGKIWSTFHSVDENRGRRGKSKIKRSNCMAEVRTSYGI